MRDTFSYGEILRRDNERAYDYLDEFYPEMLKKAHEPRSLDVLFLTHQDDIDGEILHAIIRTHVQRWEQEGSEDEGAVYEMFAEISSALDNGNCPDETRRWLLNYIEANGPQEKGFALEWDNLEKTLRYFLGE